VCVCVCVCVCVYVWLVVSVYVCVCVWLPLCMWVCVCFVQKRENRYLCYFLRANKKLEVTPLSLRTGMYLQIQNILIDSEMRCRCRILIVWSIVGSHQKFTNRISELPSI